MIITINSSDRKLHTQHMKAMHELRAEVFHERLGWDVNLVDGLEIDKFDLCDPLYVLSLDNNGKLKGSLRLLPTTGPNMLRDVFNVLMPPGEFIESPLIWESTRFCVAKEAQAERSLNKLNKTTAELLIAAFEIAQKSGINTIMSVYDGYMKRILNTAGCKTEIIGNPTRIGNVITYAGLFEVSDEVICSVREAGGINYPVFLEEYTYAAA